MQMAYHRERRNEDRRAVTRLGQIEADGVIHECVVCELSDHGARVGVTDPKTLPDEFTLLLSPHDKRSCKTVWRDHRAMGVTFTFK